MTDHPAHPTEDATATSTDNPRIVLLVGAGAHSDPWHALIATSQRIAELLHDDGFTNVRIASTHEQDDFREAMDAAEILIVNASSDLSQAAPDSAALMDAITAHWHRGGGVLASHSSALAFRDDPRWAELLGGRWVPGTTMHPQIGTSLIQAAPHTLDTLTFDDFTVYDERYTHLETSTQVQTLAIHTEDGTTHPLIWANDTHKNDGRVAYDALGHGVESYDSPAHQQVFLMLVRWIAGINIAAGQKGPA
ncbi:ThuA domain-containing protein [Arthrobacter sp. MDB2-24]